MGLAPDIEKKRFSKKEVPDGQLGFEIPGMARSVVDQLLSGRTSPSPLPPGIDPRYAPKKR